MKNIIIGLILGLIVAMLAFYFYTQRPSSTNIPLPTTLPTNIDNEALIKAAFAKKYSAPIDQISVKIKEINATQVSGEVNFSDGGGWFLAVKENNSWKIVADGNGFISCEVVAPYKFPISMLPECVDKNGNIQKL
ncbi:MAG: hypothetical protein WC784_03105 [Candidatus Shapirobacteria bacterium]|jgi:hypothetical protein